MLYAGTEEERFASLDSSLKESRLARRTLPLVRNIYIAQHLVLDLPICQWENAIGAKHLPRNNRAHGTPVLSMPYV